MSSNSYISVRAGFDTERTVTGPFSGVSQNLGTPITVNPVIMVCDNLSTVAVQLLVNGVVWKTFSAGEALVLDLRANHGNAPNFTVDIGTQFSVIGTAGTGSFSLSLIYAR